MSSNMANAAPAAADEDSRETPKTTKLRQPKSKLSGIDKISFGADEKSLVLQLALHEETILNNRVNIFLIVESLMLVLYAEVATSNESLAFPIAGFGIAVTLIWLLTSIRQGMDLKYSVLGLRKGWTNFKHIQEDIPQSLKSFSLLLLVWGLPLLFIILWCVVAADYAGLLDPASPASAAADLTFKED